MLNRLSENVCEKLSYYINRQKVIKFGEKPQNHSIPTCKLTSYFDHYNIYKKAALAGWSGTISIEGQEFELFISGWYHIHFQKNCNCFRMSSGLNHLFLSGNFKSEV